MPRRFIVLGDPTDHGGKVISGAPNHTIDGKPVARLGDKVDCPRKYPDGSPHGVNTIIEGEANCLIDGIPAALEGHKSECGCSLLSTVSAFYGGESASFTKFDLEEQAVRNGGLVVKTYATQAKAVAAEGGLLVEYLNKNWARSEFGDLLASVESKGDYSAYNKTVNGLQSFYNTDLTEMTVSEVMQKQVDRQIFAAGRYQLIPSTLRAGVSYLKIDTSSLFGSEVQDKIFNEYLIVVKRPSIINYLEGTGTVDEAIYDWAKEFASAGVMAGKKISGGRIAQGGESYYSGDGLNKAHLTPEEMIKALKASKGEN